MASQVSHIIYAQHFWEKSPLAEADKDEFLLGAIFPDIRKIDSNIKRMDTHRNFFPLNMDFEGLSSFEAGWKFHLYCDMRREDILNKAGFYKIKGAGDFSGNTAKLLEDELIYDKFNNWEKIVAYFNDPPVIDTGVNVSRETFELWYAIWAKYMEKKPDGKARNIVVSKMLTLSDRAKEIVESIEGLRKNEKAIKILKGVVDKIV